MSDCFLDCVSISGNLVISCRNVLAHKKISSILKLGLVHFLDSLGSCISILEANETLVLKSVLDLSLLDNT